MYLRRKIDKYLEDWHNNLQRKPLIIKGARQIGKTESILHFARQHYKNIININFVEAPQYKVITENGYRPEDIIKIISRINPTLHFIPGQTLIFFDELQEYPELATALKFFCQEGKYDIICSGSLLGINYQRIASISVGYKTDYQMYSLDFEEFLWSKGYQEDFSDELLAHLQSSTPFAGWQLKLCEDLFLDYCLTGGMPAVISAYLSQGTFEGILDMQRQLVADYQGDIRKYAQGMDQTRILNVFRHIPVQLAKDNKKFQVSKVATGARFKDYRGCVEWLQEAGVINLCYCLQSPELPLRGNYDANKFKIYFADTGLLLAMLDEESQADLRAHRRMDIYKGGLYENIVGEALVKSGLELYYYQRENSTLEEDFFARNADSLVPIEVKATNARAKSLKQLIRSESYGDIHFGLKLIQGNVGYADRVYTFPYFCSFLVKRFLQDFSPKHEA